MLTLANISPFVPNQIILAVVCTLVCLSILVYSLLDRNSTFWHSAPVRYCCYLNAGMAVFMSGFVILGFVAPRLQPFANLLSEVLVIASFSIICRHVGGIQYRKGESLGPVAARPRMAAVFRSAPWVMYPCLGVSLGIAIVHYFPMNTIDAKVSIYGFLYREAYLTPELLFTAAMFTAYAYTWWHHWRTGYRHRDRNYFDKLSWLVLGSFAMVAVCALHWFVTYLQTFNLELIHERGTAFWTIIVMDNVIYALMGIGWVKGITTSNYESEISAEMEQKDTYRHIRLHLTQCLKRIEEKNPQIHDYIDLCDAISTDLGLMYPEQRLAQDTLHTFVLAHGLGQIDPRLTQQKLYTLYQLRCKLLDSEVSAQEGRGKVSIQEDRLPEGVSIMTMLEKLGEKPDLRDAQDGAQIAVIVAAHFGLLDGTLVRNVLNGAAVKTSVFNAYKRCVERAD